jgi:hypothetical protein
VDIANEILDPEGDEVAFVFSVREAQLCEKNIKDIEVSQIKFNIQSEVD